MSDSDELLREIEAYLKALPSGTSMAESTFGRLAINDGKFVARLRAGGRAWPETISRVRQFIANHVISKPSNSNEPERRRAS